MILLFSLFSTIVGVMIIKRLYGIFSFSRLNVLQVMFLSHVFAQFIPAAVIVLRTGEETAKTYLFYCALVTVLIPIGGVLADLVLNVRTKTSFYRVPVDTGLASRKRFANFFLVYLAFCSLIFATYVARVPTIPIYDLVFGLREALDFQLARREASTLGSIYGMALRFYMPVLFVTGMIACTYFVSRPLRWAAIAGMLIAIAYNAWPGSKTPVATLLLMATFVMLIRSSEQIHAVSEEKLGLAVTMRARKRALRLGILLLTLVVLYPIGVFLLLPAGQLGIGYILESVFLRIFFKPAENTYAAFEMFSNGGFTYFADISKLADLLNIRHVSLSNEVAAFRGLGTLTNAPPAAIGTFYAQGGGFVVVLGVCFASFVFKFAENVLRQLATKTPLTITLYAVLIFAAFRFSWANFHSMLLSEVFLPMLTIWVLWFVFGRTSIRSGTQHSLSHVQ